MPLIDTFAHIRRLRLAVLAGTLVAAPLALGGVAGAQPAPAPAPPPPDPRAACESPAFGGVFVPVDPARAECQYIVSGSFYWDNYDNGIYTGTVTYRDGGKVPTERPPIPDVFVGPNGIPLILPMG